MTEIGFSPKEVIPQEVCRLEVLSAETADTYGPQIGLKLKVVGGEHDGHTFNGLRQPRRGHWPGKARLQSLVDLRGVPGSGLPQAPRRLTGEPRR